MHNAKCNLYNQSQIEFEIYMIYVKYKSPLVI